MMIIMMLMMMTMMMMIMMMMTMMMMMMMMLCRFYEKSIIRVEIEEQRSILDTQWDETKKSIRQNITKIVQKSNIGPITFS